MGIYFMPHITRRVGICGLGVGENISIESTASLHKLGVASFYDSKSSENGVSGRRQTLINEQSMRLGSSPAK